MLKHCRLIAYCTCVLALASCSQETGVEVRLTSGERKEVDDRVGVTMDSLRPALDSLCALYFDDRVAVATDSIVQERLEEEQRLRLRLRQKQGQ